MKAIIAAIDFSSDSINTACYAAELAVIVGARLILTNVVGMPVSAIEMSVSDYQLEEMWENSERDLCELAEKIKKRTQNRIMPECVVSYGTAPFQLEEACRNEEILAIVTGPDHPGFFARLFPRRHAKNTLRALHVPVLVIPPEASFKGIKKVVLASDLKATNSYLPHRFLRAWLATFQSKFHIVHVHPKEITDMEAVTCSVTLHQELQDFHPEFHFKKNRHIVECVERFVSDENPDLLITIPKKHGRFHISKSNLLMRHSHIPVLAIPV